MAFNEINDFELSDDSDCEYEADRRFRRLQSCHHRRESMPIGSDNSATQQNDIATQTFSILHVQATFLSVLSALDHDNTQDCISSKKCDMNNNADSSSSGVAKMKLDDPSNFRYMGSKLALTNRLNISNYCWRRNFPAFRLKFWLILPCIATLFFALYLDSAASDKVLVRGQKNRLQYGTSTTWIQHKHLEDTFGNHFDDLADLYTPLKDTDILFLWSVPFGGTDVLKDIIITCYANKTVTSVDILMDESQLMDVDVVVAREGISRIKETVPNPILVSSSLPFISSLFTTKTRGRIFTVLRNPIDRTVDQYDQYRKAASRTAFANDDNDASVSILSLEEYLTSFDSQGRYYFVDNWLTRALTDCLEPTIELKNEHLDHAKQILRQKILVGLFEKIDEFADWVGHFFRWIDTEGDTGGALNQENNHKECKHSIIKEFSHRKVMLSESSRYPFPGSDIYNTILSKNEWDMQLYWYVKDSLYYDERGMIEFIFRQQQRPVPEDV